MENGLYILAGFLLGLAVGWWLSYIALQRISQVTQEFDQKVSRMEENIIKFMEKEEKKDE